MKFPEFREMVLHYHTKQGIIATTDLWTQSVDQLARAIVVDGFEGLKQLSKGDLDNRSLGLSPALLEELCMDSHTLKEIIEGLKKVALPFSLPCSDFSESTVVGESVVVGISLYLVVSHCFSGCVPGA